jgi:hypothetical protein
VKERQMSASVHYRPETSFQFVDGGELLFKIRADGTIERGPGFTTTDAMSLKFWEAIENSRRPLPSLDLPKSEQE